MKQDSPKLKRGAIREDGKMFWGYGKTYPNGEYWVSPEKYADLKIKVFSSSKAYREKNRSYFQTWNQKNKDKLSEYGKKWYYANPEIVKAKRDRQKKKNPSYGKDYQRKRRKEPLYNLASNLRSMIANCLKEGGFKKRPRTEQILCCSFDAFKAYIESKFKTGMTWNNRQFWHLDHIIPLASATSEEELLKLNHYTNFQPLWADENIRKSNKILFNPTNNK